MDFLKDKAGAAADAVSAALREKIDALEAEKDSLASRIAAQADEFADEKKKMLEDFASEKKNMLVRGFVDRYNNLFEYLMGMVLLAVKDLMYDPYMPGFVKAMLETILDALWPEVKDQVRKTVIEEFVGTQPIDHGDPGCCGIWSPLALVRYTLFPYDRNVWRLIRNPFWWFLMLISIIPVYGISQIYFFILFLIIIDKNDEYQLGNFVNYFKSLQFASLGIVSAIQGSIQYYICTTSTPTNCDEYAPMVQIWVMCLFVVQVVMVWTAFGLIRCSVRKGGRYYQRSKMNEAKLAGRDERRMGFATALRGDALEEFEQDEQSVDMELEQKARQRLMNLLIYDFVIFLICLGLCIWATWFHLLDEDARVSENPDGAGEDNWKYHTTLFWIRAFYGLMSFPFVLLLVPGLSSVFSHAKPTGYNPYGHTVPYLGKEEDEFVPWDPHRAPRAEREPMV